MLEPVLDSMALASQTWQKAKRSVRHLVLERWKIFRTITRAVDWSQQGVNLTDWCELINCCNMTQPATRRKTQIKQTNKQTTAMINATDDVDIHQPP